MTAGRAAEFFSSLFRPPLFRPSCQFGACQFGAGDFFDRQLAFQLAQLDDDTLGARIEDPRWSEFDLFPPVVVDMPADDHLRLLVEDGLTNRLAATNPAGPILINRIKGRGMDD